MKGHLETYVILTGHTCNIAPGDYNLGLSRRRAESVEVYLVQNLMVSRGRIITKCYGETAPVVSEWLLPSWAASGSLLIDEW